MKKPIVFMFSGQGSQYNQMGKELYENHAHFRFWMDRCDEIVSPLIKTSLVDVLYRGRPKSEPFDNLLHTNPALLSVEYSLVKVLEELGITPDYLMGYSLGELTASVISGVISLEDGFRLVVEMARLAESRTRKAEMLAIMKSQKVMTEYPDLFSNCWVTGSNFADNFVVGGVGGTLQVLKDGLGRKDILFQTLPVKYGFHTELIEPIKEEFKQTVREMELAPAKIPVISNSRGGIVQEFSEDYFWDVIRYPVHFQTTVQRIIKNEDYIFIDAGPSATLATFVKYILPANSNSVSLQTINQFGRDLSSIERLKTSLSEVLPVSI
jgi:bacillaene synthase trans-acting acyltransferase